MADIDILPPDVVAELKASGVKFDDDGNIIEEEFLTDDNESDGAQDDDADEDAADATEADDEDADEADDEADEDEDDADDEDDEPVKTKAPKSSKKQHLKLTRKKTESSSQNDEIEELKRQNRKLEARIDALTKSSKYDTDADDDAPEALIQKEAMRFKHMRLQEFRRSVVKTINDLELGGTFDDIISSEEWAQYLNSKIFGVKVGDMLKSAIEETNLDDVVSVYTDFTSRYLPQMSKVKPASKQVKKLLPKNGNERLKDLATPERTTADRKGAVQSSRKSTFLYTEADYEAMLSKAERGLISHDDFVKFETKFEAARKAGRVKLSV